MKVIVFGAAGNTGKLVVRECLARKHEVTAFVRDAKKAPAGTRAIAGDMLDPSAVEDAVRGHDAVVHAVGSGSTKATTLRTDTARILVGAMEKTGVKRLVAMSGMGAGDSYALLPAPVRWFLVPLMLKGLFADQNGLEEEVKKSDLDWILIRPVGLSDKPKTGKIKVSLDYKGMGMSITYGDVAEFIAKQLESDEYLRKTPALTQG